MRVAADAVAPIPPADAVEGMAEPCPGVSSANVGALDDMHMDSVQSRASWCGISQCATAYVLPARSSACLHLIWCSEIGYLSLQRCEDVASGETHGTHVIFVVDT